MTVAEAAPTQEFAPAKLNLFLHLRGRRADGYHLLESLAVFPRLGDVVSVEDGPGLSLTVGGPFGDMLPSDGDNLVLRAAEALARAAGRPARAALHLEKTLPVASGIGGGSADAAACLRLLARRWGCPVPPDAALALGADVPVCLSDQAQMMAGIGEMLTPGPALPPFWVVLVNPLVTVSTGAVFQAVEQRDCPPGPPAPDSGFREFTALTEWLAQQRNDLEQAAIRCCPPVGDVLDALSQAPLARMSGSGGTCFSLWPTEAEALAAADGLRLAR
ncbi:MAG: 4-(cytidine 5'-diphospho)-2-C-methyl-D-erythritol kinase, partial [Pseudomonadota bacterium]